MSGLLHRAWAVVSKLRQLRGVVYDLTCTYFILGQGMESLDSNCTPLKHKYDDCFNAWFRDSFLNIKGPDHDTACGNIFKEYKTCLKVTPVQSITKFTITINSQAAVEKHNISKEELNRDLLGTDQEMKPRT